MMEAARTSETSVDNYFTRQYIPEDKSELHTRRRENLKTRIEIIHVCETHTKAINAEYSHRFLQQLVHIVTIRL
jgi:hydrogenase maturation factor